MVVAIAIAAKLGVKGSSIEDVGEIDGFFKVGWLFLKKNTVIHFFFLWRTAC